MRKWLLAALLLLNAAAASAQNIIAGDAFILGRVAVGTTTPSARFTAVSTNTAGPAFQVSGVDLTPFLRVDQAGTVGLSTFSSANLDVTGSGDSANVGLLLRGGSLYGAAAQTQLAFAASGTSNYRHVITSVHSSSTTHNSLNFLVWTPDAGITSIATMTVMSLVTTTMTTGGAVHVRPVGDASVELTVSNGATLGGGTVHTASQVSPSSRDFKTDISYLSDEERRQAYDNLKNLKPASFRYMRASGAGYVRDRRQPIHRGLIYEETPDVLRGPAQGLVMDQRLLESEMAFQELARRLEALKKEVGQ